MSERYEFIDWRVLGAVRMVDVVTQQPIPRALHVFSDTLRFVRNRLGLDVISHATGFGDYEAAFDSSDPAVVVPAQQDFTAWVEDPEREYMVRAFTVTLPRDPEPPPPRTSPGPDSLFTPKNIELLPAQGVRTGASWSVLRIRALQEADGSAFPGLLVRATNAGADAGWGMTDASGEAVVAVAGLPRFRTGPNPAQPLTEMTTLTLTFLMLPAAPDVPPGSYSRKDAPLPGFFYDWRALTSRPARPVRRDEPGSVPAQSLAAEVTPGREPRLTVRVTP